jgi:ceramide glucosyltransferase
MATDKMPIILAGLYIFLIAAKAVFAARHARRFRGAITPNGPVTIVQPILSGDPLLEPTLKRNLDAHPLAEFLWMIDDDDEDAHRVAARLAPTHASVRVVVGPGPANGENPKVAKLIHALPLVFTSRLVVLDDDTFLPATSSLPSGHLVTGLPIFSAKTSTYERLIGGFVNGSALLTYLPAAYLRLQRSINGMIYSVNTAQLRELGGFAAASHDLTDDYSVARLYLRHGLEVTQSITPVLVAMSVSNAAQYVRIMRRWMIFANHYLRDNLTPATAFWIGLPGILPLIGLIVAAIYGYPLLWVALLFAKAFANRLLLWRITGEKSSALDLLFECMADLMMPAWVLLALFQPHRLTWRSRRIELSSGEIRYE